MGWLYDGVPDEEHEGTAIGVLPNGVIPTYRVGDSWRETEFHNGWWTADDPGTAPTWLIPTCACTWRGDRIPYDPQAETAARAQWDAHMDTVTVYLLTVAKAAEALVAMIDTARAAGEFDARPLAVIKALRITQSHLNAQITAAVGAARAQDLSWEHIGESLGVTRQTAHERYRDVEAVPAQPE